MAGRLARRPAGRPVVVWGALLLWCLGVTGLLYGQALGFPFFFDDLDHMPYVARTGLADMWRSAGGFPYFRPLGATVWRLSYLALGGNEAGWLHGLNLGLHALNGWLVGLVGARWIGAGRGRERGGHPGRFGWLAATLYLFFPFHYQAVPWVGAMYHLLMTALVLAAVAAAGLYRERGRRIWLALGLAAAAAAPLAHENGALAPLLAVLLLLTVAGRERPSWRRLAALLAPWAAAGLPWLALWLRAPRLPNANLGLNNLETMGQNLVYFAQGLAYPVSWPGGWLRDTWGWNDLVAAATLSALGLALLGLAGRSTGGSTETPRPWFRPAAFPWLWAILTSLPAMLLLTFGYVISAPRLLVLPAVGFAWLWAGAVERGLTGPAAKPPSGSARPRAGRLAAAGLGLALLVVLAQNALFVGQRQRLGRLLGQAYWQATDLTTRSNAAGATPVFVNLPYAMTPARPTFAIGHEGVVYMVDYIPLDHLVSAQTGRPAALDVLRYDDIRPDLPYIYGVMGSGASWPALLARTDPAAVFVTRYEPEAVRLDPAGGTGPAPGPGPALASFSDPAGAVLPPGQALRLLAATVATEADPDRLRIDLTWQIDQPPGYDLTVFLHVVDETGRVVAQADGHPWARTYPLGQWPAGAVRRDTRWAPRPAGGFTAVRVGLYNGRTGDRLAVAAPGATVVDDSLVLAGP